MRAFPPGSDHSEADLDAPQTSHPVDSRTTPSLAREAPPTTPSAGSSTIEGPDFRVRPITARWDQAEEEAFEMRRFLRYSATLAALALVALLSTGVSARADIIVTITELGGATLGPTTVATGSPSTPGGIVYAPGGNTTVGDFTFTAFSLSEEQTFPFSEVLSSALTVTDNGTVAHTVQIAIQATGFTLPTAPPGVHVLSSVGGTTPSVGSGSPNAIAFTSQANGASPAATLSPSITGTGVAYSAQTTQDLNTGVSAPYTVFQTYFITLNPGADLQLTGRTDLSAIPEPSPLTLSVLGLPLLGLLCAYRRWRR
jgi:hypothetical protein